ncbi:Putative dihydropyrimidine dehydrogenase [NADP+], similar to dihydroorotate dehydrogenase [Acidisarcina polymorpha]|uniref:Dihydropyrimidine dehydrogenase [NADP+], similar to dihydroorotate dehydrogenase n=1 Tax=Acidisarcina polymorpha TaxID=2211140 RepID=A0A2Z5G792_9BACT|nr:dihydroorotate dehydrogenase-like protein [Acidisarcina polymorpha]AXC15122.1 Putative dihydropyrimidine dehydrogenase [NADP+], similar to dihydroorotate dehydrogenase [Acidisarcina polymorpha]
MEALDLTTEYLGIPLKNPLVVSSNPLSEATLNVRRMEDFGASAVVLGSLFEEQLNLESNALDRDLSRGTDSFPESLSYLPDFDDYRADQDHYLEHLVQVKHSVSIPIIASINGATPGGWVRFARDVEAAGADALELNTYSLATDPLIPGSEVEQQLVELVRQVRHSIRIPLAVKLSPQFTSIPNLAVQLDAAGINGLVVFNRFYQPDFDIENLTVTPHLSLSRSDELLLRLHWVAILYGRIRADLAITGGVHYAKDVLKGIMAGASVTMLTSALLIHGIEHLNTIHADLIRWMVEHEYQSIRQMRGSLSRIAVPDPSPFERGNYIKTLSSYTLRRPAFR